MSVRFINFGCWNEGGCESESGLRHIINTIRNKETNINFCIINGDNYYQIKQKDKSKSTAATTEKKAKPGKIVDQVQIRDGFNCLSSIPTQNFYLLMGNHDLEITNGKCETMEFERDYRVPNKHYHLPTQLTMYKKINSTTLIIMLDTNIYADENPQCLNIILENAPINENLNKIDQLHYLKQMQHNSVIHELQNKNYTTIIVCGHHPLVGFKNQSAKFDDEKGKMKIKGGIDTYSREIYDLFFDVIQPHATHFMYLCSDIHNYQKGTIDIQKNGKTMHIKQFITGTGGAHLDDDYNEKYNESFKETTNIDTLSTNMTATHQIDENMNVQYTIQRHYSAYGYSVISVGNNGKIEFENVEIRVGQPSYGYIDYTFNPPRKIKSFTITKKNKHQFIQNSLNAIYLQQKEQTRRNNKSISKRQVTQFHPRRFTRTNTNNR